MSYKGNRLFCSQCKYYSKEEIINGQSTRKSCKNIDHNIIQLRPSIFGGYEESYRLTDICNYYKPKAYIKNSNYTNIDSYIYFLENDFYETPKCYKLKGLSTIRHFRTITLRILKEDLEIQVIKALKSIGLKLVDSGQFNYVTKGNTDIVVEMLTLTFSKTNKGVNL